MKCFERFIDYVKWETTSDPNSGKHPSSDSLFPFAEYLKKELIKLGLDDVVLTDKCYLYATLKSNSKEKLPGIGFIAHIDTSCDCSGKNVNPVIHENYDGKDIILNKEKNIIMKVNDYPFLKNKKGESLITTDGSTLLGADDKAGVCEIISLIEYLKTNPFLYGDVKIAFTPDEEIGEGADFFDVETFKEGIDFAFTVDGGEIEVVEYENFNAASAKVIINGFNIHPGSAKDKMINSIYIANEFDQLLPADKRPEKTEKYEGFNHLNSIEGQVEKTNMHYIIRNHDLKLFNQQKEEFYKVQETLNKKYGEGTVELKIVDSYFNMADELKNKYGLGMVDLALKAITNVLNIESLTLPIRGGTDGARLTFMGLPCPNLGTGGFNFHGRYECITIEDMDKMLKILTEIVRLHNMK